MSTFGSEICRTINFYPVHVGDIKQYTDFATGGIIFTTYTDSIKVDSAVTKDRNIYYRQKNANGSTTLPRERIDTLGNVYIPFEPLYPYYKPDAVLGEKWTVGIETNGDTVLVTATVINVSSTTLFGKFTTVKSIRIVEENMPPRKPFSLGTNYLADGFGLIRTDPEPGNIYSLTGAFLGGREYGIVLSVINPHLLPNNIQLNQNFPNPFNPSTTFSFSLPSKSFVTLKIFNLLGREVATVVSEEVAVGSYSRIWNASGMPSGVYFYRLQAGTYTETKHMLLLK